LPVSATVRATNPSPAVHTVIVRSIYLRRNSAGLDWVEFGWKWLVDSTLSSHPNDTVDPAPTVFAARSSAGTYFLSEGNASGGWGLLTPGQDYAFRIEANIDGSHPSTFYFFRSGLATGSLFSPT
jgi:hypothetical protein